MCAAGVRGPGRDADKRGALKPRGVDLRIVLDMVRGCAALRAEFCTKRRVLPEFLPPTTTITSARLAKSAALAWRSWVALHIVLITLTSATRGTRAETICAKRSGVCVVLHNHANPTGKVDGIKIFDIAHNKCRAARMAQDTLDLGMPASPPPR